MWEKGLGRIGTNLKKKNIYNQYFKRKLLHYNFFINSATDTYFLVHIYPYIAKNSRSNYAHPILCNMNESPGYFKILKQAFSERGITHIMQIAIYKRRVVPCPLFWKLPCVHSAGRMPVSMDLWIDFYFYYTVFYNRLSLIWDAYYFCSKFVTQD